MTKEQWIELERELTSPYGYAKLLVDGFEISLQVQLDKMKLCIAVYINGSIKVSHAFDDCEERRRFLCPRKYYLYTAKERAAWKKMPKRLLKNIDPDRFGFTYTPWWNSFKSLKAHLTKNNSSIELVSEN